LPMTVLPNDVASTLPYSKEIAPASQTPQPMRVLAPREINAVAGGPESSVGTGLNPT
jgi:hypothetical protein